MLNLDCNHYVNNSKVVREAMCFFMDIQLGNTIGFVQFPLRFDSLDRHDRYANKNTVLFDVSPCATVLELNYLPFVGLVHFCFLD